MKHIGLLTYHATHNYGAVFQAYATQYTIEKMGYRCEVIDFRPVSMRDFDALYKFHTGFIAGLYRFFRYWLYQKPRKDRAKRFEEFISKQLNLTKRFKTIESLEKANLNFDLTITGSDQTWNIHCPLWGFSVTDLHYAKAYMLGFVTSGNKASFAASISDTTTEELMQFKDLLCKYSYITVRDAQSKPRIDAVTGKDSTVVLDPSFLLTKEEYIRSLNVPDKPLIDKPYVLLYSIQGYKEIDELMKQACIFAKNNSLLLVSVTPNACKKYQGAVQLYNVGPLDFLNLYNNASFVLAHTFHAICFSIIFRKAFFGFGYKENKKDIRKISLLEQFGLETRLLIDESAINNGTTIDLDYSNYENKILSAIAGTEIQLRNILKLSEE
jgi:hypothetical protein